MEFESLLNQIESQEVAGSKPSRPSDANRAAKRKSIDNIENLDNISPADLEAIQAPGKGVLESNKKPKTVFLPPSEPSFVLETTSASTAKTSTVPVAGSTRSKLSSLPRFNANPVRPSKASLTPKAKPAPSTLRERPAASASTTAPAPSTSAPSLSTNSSTVVSHAPTTPRRVAVNREANSPTPAKTPSNNANTNVFKKFSREILNELTGSYFATQVNNNFPANLDEKLNTIFAALKVKSKWDVKEKLKKQEAVIKDLKDLVFCLKDAGENIKQVCGGMENKITSQLRDMFDSIIDSQHLIASLQAQEKKVKKELEVVAQENKNQKHTMESQIMQLTQQIHGLETNSLVTKKEYQHLQEKYDELRASQAQSLEEKTSQLKLEIANLTSENLRLRSNYENSLTNAQELNNAKLNAKEEMNDLKAQLKDAHYATETLEREIIRLNQETKSLKENILRKDDDIRQQMTTTLELSKLAQEEKNKMWSELSEYKTSMAVLEEEKKQLTYISTKLQVEHDNLTSELTQMNVKFQHLQENVEAKDNELSKFVEVQHVLDLERELRQKFENREENERRERIAITAQYLAMQQEMNKTLAEKDLEVLTCKSNYEQEISALQATIASSQEEMQRNQEMIAGLRSEVSTLHQMIETSSAMVNQQHQAATIEEISRKTGEIEALNVKIAELSNQIAMLTASNLQLTANYEDKLKISESQRRKLHNMLQELRGNIRVFGRVRPFLPNDAPGIDLSNPDTLPPSAVSIQPEFNHVAITNANGLKNDFVVDKVFGPSSAQEQIFSEVSEFVQSALDGYNVCLFSYGQTGSGKTHTMNGSGDGAMRGIIPRAIEQIGKYKSELMEKGWTFTMEVSYLEIYNETIRDLLRDYPGIGSAVNNTSSGEIKHEIKKDSSGNLFVTELTKIPIEPENTNQMAAIMEIAAKYRSTSNTLMNETSSRSHAVFTLYLRANNAVQRIELSSSLNLVDLAGSERVNRSGVTGAEFKEAVAINKSLSSLCDVFTALANKQSHIPFRNSKLTYLLQPALSGDGKTLMIVNLSPTEESYQESLSSLRFASQVNQCELGKPKKRIVMSNPNTSSSMDEDNSMPSLPVTSTPAKSAPTPSKRQALESSSSHISSTKQLSSSLGSLKSNVSGKSAVESSAPLSSSLGSKKVPSSNNLLSSMAAKKFKK